MSGAVTGWCAGGLAARAEPGPPYRARCPDSRQRRFGVNPASSTQPKKSAPGAKTEKKRNSGFVRRGLRCQFGGMDLKLGGRETAIDLVIFDCDGVLLDSMEQKIRAFREWVPAAHAAHGEAFRARVMHGFGRSRRYHIEGFYSELLGTPLSPDALEREIARFTGICEPLCAEAGWLPGSLEFVQACRLAGAVRYVLSGTPHQPLVEMLAAHGAREVSAEEPEALFHRILGSPPAKPEQMEGILLETGIPAQRAVFIGDAEADRVAAEHVGAHFVYKPSAAARPAGEMPTIVEDLRELLV